LVEQHRHGVDATTLEPAGGIIDDGEAPAIAAARELFEETGYRARDVESLGWVHPNPALSSNRSHLYFFDGVVREAEPKASSDERTHVVLLDEPTLREALDGGRITHALSVVALERTLNRIMRRGTSEKGR
jgi:8-oxo-dGTP pyrophosphatase MutT (NUDIX family)